MKKQNASEKKLSLDKLQLVRIKGMKSIMGGKYNMAFDMDDDQGDTAKDKTGGLGLDITGGGGDQGGSPPPQPK